MGEEWFKLCEICPEEKKSKCIKLNHQRFKEGQPTLLCDEVKDYLSYKKVIDRPDRWLIILDALELDNILGPDCRKERTDSEFVASLFRGIFIFLDNYLNKIDTEILRRYFLYGDTLSQISKKLNMPISTIQSKRNSALKKLRVTPKFIQLIKEIKIEKKS